MRDSFDGQDARRSAHSAWIPQGGTGSLSGGMTPSAPAAAVTRLGAQMAGDEAREEHGANIATMRWLAVGHVAGGLCGAIAGLIVWLTTRGSTPLVGVAAGLAVALAGAVTFLLAATWRAEVRRVVRLLLPLVDVAACVIILTWTGPSALALTLFLVPACVATVALSWRSGAAITALDIALFVVVNVIREPGMDSWVPSALLLAGVSSLLAFAYGVFAAQMARGMEILERQNERLRLQRDQQNVEQQRLLEGLNLMEETQARLEQERGLINAQVAELTAVAYRLAEGDMNIARTLRPGMSGSLDVLSGALLRMSQMVAGAQGAQQMSLAQKRQLDFLAASLRDQTALLMAAETTLRDLDASARALVGEVQRVERGSGELPGLDRHALFQALRGVEQRAMEQAANTGVLSSRLAQARGRQAELEAETRRAAQAMAEGAFNPAMSFAGSYPGMAAGGLDSSGLFARQAMGAPATPSWPNFPPGR